MSLKNLIQKQKNENQGKCINLLGILHLHRLRKKINNFGYLKHVEDCQRCLPYQPPLLHLNETVKRMAQTFFVKIMN
jgi:hypothetical protein